MSYVQPNQPLWKTIESIATDEALSLYELERVGPGSLRVTIDRKLGAHAEGAEPPSDSDIDDGNEAGSFDADDVEAVDVEAVDAQGGVTSGDCTRLCRRLMVYFEAEGSSLGIPAEPEIEVSSPGINRALRLDAHWIGAIGERVKVVFHEHRVLSEGAKSVSLVVGKLSKFSVENIEVIDEQGEMPVHFPLSAVKRANVDFLFD